MTVPCQLCGKLFRDNHTLVRHLSSKKKCTRFNVIERASVGTQTCASDTLVSDESVSFGFEDYSVYSDDKLLDLITLVMDNDSNNILLDSFRLINLYDQEVRVPFCNHTVYLKNINSPCINVFVNGSCSLHPIDIILNKSFKNAASSLYNRISELNKKKCNESTDNLLNELGIFSDSGFDHPGFGKLKKQLLTEYKISKLQINLGKCTLI